MTREEAKTFLLQLNTDKQLNKSEHEALRIAIKVLGQESCPDVISRQAVIDACDQSINLFEAVDRIKELEPVTPKPKTGHWIPVSERLPLLMGLYKISDDVLVTNGYENYLGYLVERKGKIFWHYYGSDIEVGINDNDDDVTAWMPLPEPYKPQESEDKE